MASKREQVAEAIKVMLATALPGADVARNDEKARRIGPGGLALLHDGDPGEADVTLSPLSYTWSHAFELEVFAYESATKSRSEVLDDMLRPIGAAVAADRTLGGLCEWLDAAAPAPEDVGLPGQEPARSVQLTLTAIYTTTNPLT